MPRSGQSSPGLGAAWDARRWARRHSRLCSTQGHVQKGSVLQVSLQIPFLMHNSEVLHVSLDKAINSVISRKFELSEIYFCAAHAVRVVLHAILPLLIY